ncbi:unnamed protein product [Symbiodinium sp. KB8]|nr:unnamed protein product [Symbiodinium sp. KB8]
MLGGRARPAFSPLASPANWRCQRCAGERFCKATPPHTETYRSAAHVARAPLSAAAAPAPSAGGRTAPLPMRVPRLGLALAAAPLLALALALAGARGALAACNATAKVVVVSRAALGLGNASTALASGADAVAAAALAFQNPPAQLAAAAVCATLLAEASDGTASSVAATMERLRADPTITAAIALLPRSDCPAL